MRVLVWTLVLAGFAFADSVTWEGILWTDVGGLEATYATPGSDLKVTPDSTTYYGVAHYNTSPAFRASPTQFVEVKFTDTGGPERAQIWMEDENTSPLGSAGAWTQFGSWYGYSANYQVYYDDYDQDLLDNGTVDFSVGTFFDTGVAATAGMHTLGLGKRADGTVDWLLDGNVVLSLGSGAFSPAYFGDIYLAARYGTATFNGYTASTAYTPPMPEPGVALLLCLGLAACFRRRP